MQKIAILYICTGKYQVLWKEFYESFEKLFLTSCSKDYYVFTDADSIEYEQDNHRIHRIYQEALPWPYPTLLRFKMFLKIEKELKSYDYIFFFNSNAEARMQITEEMILPRKEFKESLVMVKHPSFNWSVLNNPYDRNFHSKAYIPYGLGKVYIQACILGGTSKAFMRMTKTISDRIDRDLKKDVIALWHDESYVNRYLVFRRDYRLLGREFARQRLHPDSECVILMRPKEDYFNVESVKAEAEETALSKNNLKWNHYNLLLAEIIKDKFLTGKKK